MAGSNAKVDFLMSYQGNPLPIEVKAGATYRLINLPWFLAAKVSQYVAMAASEAAGRAC